MSPISFNIHADGTCEFDDPQTYQITAADPALTIALVFSFWQMGRSGSCAAHAHGPVGAASQIRPGG